MIYLLKGIQLGDKLGHAISVTAHLEICRVHTHIRSTDAIRLEVLNSNTGFMLWAAFIVRANYRSYWSVAIGKSMICRG